MGAQLQDIHSTLSVGREYERPSLDQQHLGKVVSVLSL